MECSLPALRGELLATRALAGAAAGHLDDSVASSSQATEFARSAEAKEFCAWADCVRDLAVADPTTRVLQRFRVCIASGCVHAFVCAYRAAPSILAILASENDVRSDLQAIILRARDETLARRAGLTFHSQMSPTCLLVKSRSSRYSHTDLLIARLLHGSSSVKERLRFTCIESSRRRARAHAQKQPLPLPATSRMEATSSKAWRKARVFQLTDASVRAPS